MEHRGQVVEYIEVARRHRPPTVWHMKYSGAPPDEMPPQTRKLLTLIQQMGERQRSGA